MSELSEIQLEISGMKCAGCVVSVEKALNDVEGVDSASVNFADHTALVAGKVDINKLLDAVKNAGYAALPASQSSQSKEDRETDLKKN